MAAPAEREIDGLAVSPANARLSPEEREAAPALFRALLAAQLLHALVPRLGAAAWREAFTMFVRSSVSNETVSVSKSTPAPRANVGSWEQTHSLFAWRIAKCFATRCKRPSIR